MFSYQTTRLSNRVAVSKSKSSIAIQVDREHHLRTVQFRLHDEVRITEVGAGSNAKLMRQGLQQVRCSSDEIPLTLN